MSDPTYRRERVLPQDSQIVQKKPYQKPLIKTETVQFEKVGTCLKQTGYGTSNPCAKPRRS